MRFLWNGLQRLFYCCLLLLHPLHRRLRFVDYRLTRAMFENADSPAALTARTR
jgi:hypothetical protein